MRNWIVIFSIFVFLNCFSQNKQILYNFNSVPQSMMVNPGSDVKYNRFVGIPLLSGISANIGSSGFSVHDLFANDGIDFTTKLRNVVQSSTRQDKLAINEQVEIFSGGFALGDWQNHSYLSFGMYQEFYFFAYFPKDYALLFMNGNKDYLGKVFDMSDLNAKGEMLTVFHLGYNKKISEKFIFGVRGKIYSSMFNFSSTYNTGYFYTIQGTNSVYNQVILADGMVNTSGLTNYLGTSSGFSSAGLLKTIFLGGNRGLGLDLGLTYYPKENLQFTASVIDLGFINHTKEVENYRYKGHYNYVGLQPDFIQGNSVDLGEEFNNAIPLDTLHTKYKTWRPLKFNSSMQYSFGDGRSSDCICTGGNENKFTNAVGAQWFVMAAPRAPVMAFTTYYRRQIFDSLAIKTTYTIDAYSARNIGLGLSSAVGKFNFYLLADNLLEYMDLSKAKSLSFQFGFNVIVPDKNSPD